MPHETGSMTLCVTDDLSCKVRYRFYTGCEQSFNPMTGIGHEAEDAEIYVTEVNFGTKWESPDVYPQIDWDAFREEMMEYHYDFRLAD